LHVTRQDVACFVLCVLIKIPCLITTFRRQILFTRRSSRSGTARNNNSNNNTFQPIVIENLGAFSLSSWSS